jgi:predicted DNA-binding protein (UPF0251 family)
MFRTEEEEALKSERTIRLVGTGLINLELAMRSLGISTGTIWQLAKTTRGKSGLVPTSLF